MTEKVVPGIGNALQNVVVYISAGESEASPAPATPANFDKQNCRYTTHVLAVRVGQDVSISNSDPFGHNIHRLAKVNREWNRIQPEGTTPFSYSYDKEEIIPVKCKIHAWMQAYFVVLRTSHFAVAGQDGEFKLPELPPGKYTVTAWHETFGILKQDINVTGGETRPMNFVFKAAP